MKELIKAADHVFYQSDFCKLSADRYLGPCTGGWEILYNAVDTEDFVPGPEIPIAEGPVLRASGSHMQFHRVESVVRAFALVLKTHPVAKLVVAGHLGWRADSRSAGDELRKLCADLGVTAGVSITGRYTQAEAARLLQSAHQFGQSGFRPSSAPRVWSRHLQFDRFLVNPAPQRPQQGERFERLDDELVDAGRQAALMIFRVSIGGDRNHRQAGMVNP